MKTLTEFSSIVLRRAADARSARAAETLEPEALVTALAADLGLAEDRVKRLVEALDVAGTQLDKVRLVRVFQGETAPPGATTVGEFHYSLDRVDGGGRKRSDDRRGGGGRGDRDRGGGGGRGGDMFGAPKKDKPRGLGTLMAQASGVKKDDGEERTSRGEVPKAGIGWQLTAAPYDPKDSKGGPRGRGPRRDGPPGRDDRGRPGGRGRGPGGPGGGPGGGGPGGGPGGAPRSAGPGGPRPDGRGPGGPPGDRGPRRGGRGRGGGGGAPGGPRVEYVNQHPAAVVEAQPGQAVTEAAPSVTPPTPPSPSEPQE